MVETRITARARSPASLFAAGNVLAFAGERGRTLRRAHLQALLAGGGERSSQRIHRSDYAYVIAEGRASTEGASETVAALRTSARSTAGSEAAYDTDHLGGVQRVPHRQSLMVVNSMNVRQSHLGVRGLGGPTLAFWLKTAGFEPTLIERAPALRAGGFVIDFWGLGYDLAERMGLANDIERAGYHMRELRISMTKASA